MKNIYRVLLYMLIIAFASCSNECDDISGSNTFGDDCSINFYVDKSMFQSVIQGVEELVIRENRTSQLVSEDEFKKVLTPLVPVGVAIQNELLDLNEMGILTKDEYLIISQMDESCLAELAFSLSLENEDIYASYNDITLNSSRNNTTTYQYEKELTRDDYIDCFNFSLFELTGNMYVSGTKTLLTATTVKTVAVAIAKRTAGWIGVAYTIYRFKDCLDEKKKSKT